MAHLFEDAPDGRQADTDPTVTSRFRAQYRALTDAEKATHDAIKAKASELEALFVKAFELRHPPAVLTGDFSGTGFPHLVPGEPYEPTLYPGVLVAGIGASLLDNCPFGIGMVRLEEAVMWTVKGLTA
jgi:hypothetical protein